MITSSLLAQNLSFVRSKIKKAAHQSGRKTDNIKIIAVTKELPPESWNYVHENIRAKPPTYNPLPWAPDTWLTW